MGEILGDSLIPGVPAEPASAPDPPITDPEDPKFFEQMQPQIDFMEQLLQQIRNLR